MLITKAKGMASGDDTGAIVVPAINGSGAENVQPAFPMLRRGNRPTLNAQSRKEKGRAESMNAGGIPLDRTIDIDKIDIKLPPRSRRRSR